MDNEILTREALKVEYHNERARQRGLAATLDVTEWIRTLDHFQWTCAYCMGPYEVLEHFIPLELQGDTSAQNCIPACLSCNARKCALHPGALSWVAPSALLYIRSYFASQFKCQIIPPRRVTVNTVAIDRPDAIYTIRDIVDKFKVGEVTVRRLIRSGQIQGVLIHGVWKFSEADIAGLIPTTTFHTLQETAEILGVADKTVRRWLTAGQIESVRMGRQIRIPEQEVRRFMDLRRRARVRKAS